MPRSIALKSDICKLVLEVKQKNVFINKKEKTGSEITGEFEEKV